MKRLFAGCSTAVLLAACSNSDSAASDYADDYANQTVVENLAAENLVLQDSSESAVNMVQPAATPQQNYDFREGELYGYLGAVSEERSKKGVASPPVVMFRYTGYWDGAHHLQWVSDSGAVLQSAECNVPCVAIKK